MGFYEATTHPQIKRYKDKRTGKFRYLVRYRTDQNRSTMKRGFGTLRDAKAFLVEVESAKADGSFVPASAGRVTIEELSAPWLAHKQAVTSKTYGRTLASSWETHVQPRWAQVAVSAIRPDRAR